MATKTTVATTNTPEKKEQTFEFIGKGWFNTAKTKKGEMKVLSLAFDMNIESVTIKKDTGEIINLTNKDRITLWPNNKRENKQDADLRATIAVDV